MKRFSKILIGLLVLTLAITACAPAAVEEPAEEAVVEAPAEPKEDILLGNLQDESGAMSALSTALTYAATMKIEEVNAAGGINGRMIKLITHDTRGDVNEAISAYTRMVEQDKVVAVLGPPISNIGIGVAPVAEELKVPIVGLFMEENAILQQSGEPWHYMFLAQATSRVQGLTIGAYAVKELGVKTAATLYNSANSYSVGLAASFKTAITDNGSEVVAEEIYKAEDKDFRAQLTKIIALNPDAIYFSSYPPEIPLILTQAYELGYEGYMLCSNSLPPTGLAPTTDPVASAKAYYPYGINSADPELQTWAAEYEAKFGVKPLAQSFSGADAFGMMLVAIEACGDDVTSACITEEMNKITDYEGFQGKITISPTLHQPVYLPLAIMRVVDGAPQFVMWYSPDGPAE